MSFGAELQAYAKKRGLEMEKVARAATFQLSREVIEATPRDKGGAQGGWQASVDTPAGGATERQSAQAAVDEAASVTLGAFGKVYYLVNKKPYIKKLEYGGYPEPGSDKTVAGGFSRQAPQGMVRLTIKNYRAALKRAIAENVR